MSFSLAPEGRNTRKENVEDDTAGPDVSFRSVALAEDLRSHVISRSHDIRELLSRFEEDRKTEISAKNASISVVRLQ